MSEGLSNLIIEKSATLAERISSLSATIVIKNFEMFLKPFFYAVRFSEI